MPSTPANSTHPGHVGRTKLAAWGLITRLVEQALSVVLMLLVTPIVISGLGRELYGAWLIILQATNNLSRFDLRPNGTLRVTLAISQHSDDYNEKRRQIGAAVIVWVVMIPVLTILGLVLIAFTPSLLQLPGKHIQTARVAMGIAAISVIISQIANMPRGILSGMNLYHRGIGVKAVVSLAAAGFMVLAIALGTGLVGVAIANGLQIILSGILIYLVAKRALPWLGLSMPSRAEIKRFFKLTSWLFLSNVAWAFINSSDLILVGFLLGSDAGATYATTGTVVRNVNTFTYQFRNAVASGIAELIGNQEWGRVSTLLAEAKNLSMAVFAIAGAGIIVLNESFLKLWLGEGFYSDDITNLFLVLTVFADQLIGLDINVVESLLALREQTIYTLVGGMVFIGLSVILTPLIGLKGIAIAAFISRIVWGSAIQWLIMQRMQIELSSYLKAMTRTFMVCVLLYVFSFFLSHYVKAQTWLSFLVLTLLLGHVFAVVMWILGFGAQERKQLIKRARGIVPRLKKTTGEAQ